MKSANSDLSTVPLAFVSIAAGPNNKTTGQKCTGTKQHNSEDQCQAECKRVNCRR
jgi:hypothetical protein